MRQKTDPEAAFRAAAKAYLADRRAHLLEAVHDEWRWGADRIDEAVVTEVVAMLAGEDGPHPVDRDRTEGLKYDPICSAEGVVLFWGAVSREHSRGLAVFTADDLRGGLEIR